MPTCDWSRQQSAKDLMKYPPGFQMPCWVKLSTTESFKSWNPSLVSWVKCSSTMEVIINFKEVGVSLPIDILKSKIYSKYIYANFHLLLQCCLSGSEEVQWDRREGTRTSLYHYYSHILFYKKRKGIGILWPFWGIIRKLVCVPALCGCHSSLKPG